MHEDHARKDRTIKNDEQQIILKIEAYRRGFGLHRNYCSRRICVSHITRSLLEG
jgi:hypothetical protein